MAGGAGLCGEGVSLWFHLNVVFIFGSISLSPVPVGDIPGGSHSALSRTQPPDSGWDCAGPGAGFDGPAGSLPTQDNSVILWFYETLPP